MKKRICHITTVHSANDTRIYIKECKSLSQAGYEVFLVAPKTSMASLNDSVHIEFLPKEENRFFRLIRGQWRAFKKALKIKASLYQALKLFGKKVVYDVHEDLPRQILTKHWLPCWSRKGIAFAAEFVEWIGAKFFDGIVIVAPVQQHDSLLIKLLWYKTFLFVKSF